ncbi:TetR/AcrR family transcriptional regulator [Nocardioides sp. LHG3406-4]|uniref:TetR/AcrR family transcriptional regulator n=1 Tax=Nocardioides sp. LHG3406-4 TaxID=2804575 RepID=UPI003CF95B53
MARPREFDADEAVERAKCLFWDQGFHATSVSDLAGALGLGAGSLYAAFGSKEGLYQRALERYCEEQPAALIEALDCADGIRAGLRGILVGLMEMDLAEPRGCFLVNATVERDDHPATIDRVSATLARVESALTGALERAKAGGELGVDKDPAALARFFLTFIQGLRVVGQARLGRAAVESAIASALTVLD